MKQEASLIESKDNEKQMNMSWNNIVYTAVENQYQMKVLI